MTQDLILKAQNNFNCFIHDIFALSFPDGFVSGEYPIRIGKFLENDWTMRISARDHFKSTSLYAHFMWQSMKNADKDLECHYFSYQQGMAGYHIGKIRQFIALNPIFQANIIDLKKNAENVLKISWDGKHFHTLVPHGLLSFKRGIHCDMVYIDDPFQDPASKMQTLTIEKINLIIKTQILDMPKKGGHLHIAGTPQTTEDFFFDKKLQKSFETLFLPAIVDEKNKVALWPEWMSYEKLMQKKDERGDRIFRQEYLCSPVYTELAFFTKPQIMDVVNPDLKNVSDRDKYDSRKNIIAGFDIGKKVHPSHLSVLEEQEDGTRVLIYERWIDGWDYTRQVEFLERIIEVLGIDRLFYDSSRGEFDSFQEQGTLPAQMEPVPFTNKNKFAMAAEFEKAVMKKKIQLQNNQRSINQILLVDNDLLSIATAEGHSDNFWSLCLAYWDKAQPQPSLEIW
jgi:hypothetical protein